MTDQRDSHLFLIIAGDGDNSHHLGGGFGGDEGKNEPARQRELTEKGLRWPLLYLLRFEKTTHRALRWNVTQSGIWFGISEHYPPIK